MCCSGPSRAVAPGQVTAEMQAGSTALFVPFYPSMDPRNMAKIIARASSSIFSTLTLGMSASASGLEQAPAAAAAGSPEAAEAAAGGGSGGGRAAL